MVTFYLGPRSYTGQDMVEFQCPGNPALLERLVRHVMQLGARLAQPGEFTCQAFLSGKLDLTQAEGVAATIAAEGDSQLHAAALLRQGVLGRLAKQLTSALADQLALVEAGIDFADQEDVVAITPRQLQENISPLMDQLNELLSHSQPWRTVESLPRVVLVGAPASGKSTLFNALLGQRRAVIASAAHTTRDVLVEPLTLQSPQCGRRMEVLLVDIAGLDTPVNALDRQVQAAARQAADEADLILLVHDHRPPLDHRPYHAPVIPVRTKVDLTKQDADHGSAMQTADVLVSGITGAGLEPLRTMIAQRLERQSASISGQLLVLQPRHESALRQALHHLSAVAQLLAPQLRITQLNQQELVAASLRQALNELESLGGRMTTEDILGRVFATFCVGK